MAATLRKRTRRGAAATSDAAPSEDSPAAAETSSMAPPIIWAWLSDSDQWMEYSADISSQITAAMKEGKKSVTVEVYTGTKMNILLTAMTQMNASSSGGGVQREVQCGGTPCGAWERQGGDGWTPFSEAMSRLLTAARVCGVDEVTVSEGSEKIPVNMVDLVTDGKERVRCVPTVTTTPAAWQWKDKAGAWHRYPAAVNKKLEAMYCDGGRMVIVTGRGFETKVDLWDTANVKRLIDTKKETPPTGSGTSSSTGSTTTASTKSTAKKKKASSKEQSSAAADEEVSVMKSKRFTGRAAVDEECTVIGKTHVLCEGDDVWTAMLNQTNLKNNNNKFYMLQLLEDDKKRAYRVWFRWGRVGKTGQHSLEDHGGNLTSAKASFTKKFHDKTNNRWDERNNFIKVPGKYDLLAMDYGSEEGEEETDAGVKEEEREKVESKLDQRLQDLVSMICNVKAMEDTVKELKYDTKKAPLGKLTTAQIKMGYSALKKIEELINKNTKGDPLVRACDQFYTRIPHDFGMQRPPIISTMAEVRQKLALLEALGDIQIAMSVLHHRKDDEHPIDTHYRELHCGLTPVDKEDEVFSMVERYVRQTHGKTHTQYSLSVQELFEVDREGEKERFTDVGNRQLLWHGSRLTNWVGILNQGLRVAPPEAPVTGYMFGKGVYFADCSSKSANYCFASPSKSEALLLLCEVALGKPNELLAANYNGDQLPTGTHCVKGLGRIAPDPAHTHKLSNGCTVPLGLTMDTGVLNTRGYTLNYNEYVVYKPSQILMKYLVKLKFNFS